LGAARLKPVTVTAFTRLRRVTPNPPRYFRIVAARFFSTTFPSMSAIVLAWTLGIAWTIIFHGDGDAVKLCFTLGKFKATHAPICFSVGGTNWPIGDSWARLLAYWTIAWTLIFHGESAAVKLCFTFGNFKGTLVPICFSV